MVEYSAFKMLVEEKKMKLCITCGKNEQVNDFYKECLLCILKYERENKKMKLGEIFVELENALIRLAGDSEILLDLHINKITVETNDLDVVFHRKSK